MSRSSASLQSGAGAQRIAISVLLILLGVGLLLPLVFMFRQAFLNSDGSYAGLAYFRAYMESPALLDSLQNTIYVSAMTTLIAVPLAFAFAYALARSSIRGKWLFKAAALLPLFAPTMMHGIALTYLFGNQGAISTGLFGLLPFEMRIPLYGPVGIILSEVIYTFPQAFLILSAALAVSDQRLYEAAMTMGAGALRKLFTVTLPSMKYAFAGAVTVCFTLSFTDFGAPKVVGGTYHVLATDIFKQVVGQQNLSLGAVVSIVLCLPAVLAFVVDRVVTRKQQAYVTSRSTPYRTSAGKLGNTAAYLYAGLVTLGIALLLGAVISASLDPCVALQSVPYAGALSL